MLDYGKNSKPRVAKLRGVSILVTDTNPEDKAMVRITKVGRMFAVADVFNRNYKRLQKDFASFVLSLVGYYPMQVLQDSPII